MQEPTPRTLLTVKQFARKHEAFTEGSLRFQIFNANPRKTSLGDIPGNGLDAALLRLGRKVLIDESKFFNWLEQQNQAAGGAK